MYLPTSPYLSRLSPHPLQLVDIATEEWMMSLGDFIGKVMFSSSLLYGNFLTIEQRRLLAMHAVEEGNK